MSSAIAEKPRAAAEKAVVANVRSSPTPVSRKLRQEPHVVELNPRLEAADVIDRAAHAMIARFTNGMSPSALAMAQFDWAMHLAASPGKLGALVDSAMHKWIEFGRVATESMIDGSDDIRAVSKDPRFKAPAWNELPFRLMADGFELTQAWWKEATTGVRGASPHHLRMVEFAARQVLDVFSPSNWAATNPEVLTTTQAEGGANLVRGLTNAIDDAERNFAELPPEGMEKFRPGETVAVTPGKVVFRNRLIELIQYGPSTNEVHPEPVLIVPAWIMKYYILDLSPQNSMIRHLVAAGFTVFCISWKNPGTEDRDLGLQAYRELGPVAALQAIEAICGPAKVHGCGYCLGGTLLSIEAARQARDGDERFGSITLLAAQTDFTQAGELMLFIDESQLTLLEDMMWERGYLDTKQMAGAFQMLRSRDLVWSRMVHDYLLGKRVALNDLMAWNSDATRMPFRMHAEYLQHLFLDNDLAEGRYKVGDSAVAIEDIEIPIFAVGTETDHVAPWKSVHKITLMADSEVTFVLTKGGHNAGIVSEPGHKNRAYRIATKAVDAPYVDTEHWAGAAQARDGSWWLAWFDWLAKHSGEKVAPPPMGAPAKGYAPVADAPGAYVLMP
ncbi:MAG: alpha/beta fold hydrolase [Phyllobacteriaceae bacterium]|nr:alpha/beta fold hydrolase [Phyllobacteriaceae bacterium]